MTIEGKIFMERKITVDFPSRNFINIYKKKKVKLLALTLNHSFIEDFYQ